MKKGLLWLFLLGISLWQNLTAANNYGLADNIQDGVILHCFGWSYNQIKEELPDIAKAGFTSVQTSPAQNAGTGNWYWLYQPSDFICSGNALGSRTDLQALCSEADKYGIKVIVDVVANHLNGSMDHVDKKWHNDQYWHNFSGGVNYNNRYEITHGEIGMRDLNSEHPTVQNAVRTYIMDLKSLGVDGIRWDAAKHIGLPSEGCDFWKTVTNGTGMWHYGEILMGATDDDKTDHLMTEYSDYISVTDNVYGVDTRRSLQNETSRDSHAKWAARGVPDNKIVYWAESHDSYANNGKGWDDSRWVAPNHIDRAWALIASRKGATALYFSRPGSNSEDKIMSGEKGSTHFTCKEVAAVNHFHNAMIGQPDYYISNNDAMAVCRTKGAVIVKARGSGNVTISNGGGTVTPGAYKDEITGNSWTVTSTQISGNIGSSGIAVIYDYENGIRKDATVTFSPNGGPFRTQVQNVTATLNDATSGWYQISTGNKVSFTGSKTFSIGDNMDYGESVTVSWGATGDTGEKTGNVTFTKVDANAKVYVYYNNPESWSSVNSYIYNESATPVIENGAWPGKPMTYDAGMTINGIKGWWVYEVPENLLNGSKMIVNNGAGGKQYPTGMEPGLDIAGASMVLSGTTWEPGGPSVTQNLKIRAVYFSAVNSTNNIEVSTSVENANARNLTYSYTVNGSSVNTTGAYCSFYPENGENTVNVTVTDGTDTAKKSATYICGSSAATVSSATQAGDKMYIVGTVNSWGSGADNTIVAGADGIYTANIDWSTQSGETDGCYYFRIYPVLRTDWTSESYAPPSENGGIGSDKVNMKIEADKDYSASLLGPGTESCWYVAPGKYTLTFDGTTLRLSTRSKPVVTDPVEFAAPVQGDNVDLTVTGCQKTPVYRAVIIPANGVETATAGTISGNRWSGAQADRNKTVRFYADVDGYTIARNIVYTGTSSVEDLSTASQEIITIGNMLLIKNCDNADIVVANTLGHIIFTRSGVTGEIAMELAKGIYIIKASDTVKKVIIN